MEKNGFGRRNNAAHAVHAAHVRFDVHACAGGKGKRTRTQGIPLSPLKGGGGARARLTRDFLVDWRNCVKGQASERGVGAEAR